MNFKYPILIFVVCFVSFLPFLTNPTILTAKDNDLGRNYVPIYQDIKTSFFKDKRIPLWSNRQMMGEPLIGNPLSSLFYPLNIIFLIFGIKFASVLYLFLHFLLAAVSTFFLARAFKLSKSSSVAAAIFYAFSIKLLLHTSAGHLTMIAAFSYFPLLFLSVVNLTRANNFKWVATIAFSSAFLFFTYPTVFYYSILFIFSYLLYLTVKGLAAKRSINIKMLYPIATGLILGLGLSAVSLIPLLEFNSFSNRSALTLEEVALPLWNLKRFLSSLVFPYLNLKEFDHESLLYIGAVPSVLFIFGFLKLENIKKTAVAAGALLTLLFAAGLSTPLFKIAYETIPFLQYSRITTRPWFIMVLLASLVAASFLHKLKNGKLTTILIVVFLIESHFIFYQKLKIIPNLNFSNQKLYQYLEEDRGTFNLYCTTYCFNPQQTVESSINLLNGETPIQNGEFVDFLQKAGHYNFDNFAVIFPPYQIWQVQNPPVPDTTLLGQAGVKYVASTYPIEDESLKNVGKFQDIFLYQNEKYQNIFRFEDTQDEITALEDFPNYQKLTFRKSPSFRDLIIARNYYPGWEAKIGNEKMEVERFEDMFTKVKIPPNSDTLELSFVPKTLIAGKTITLGTLFLILMYFWYIRKSKHV